MINWKDNIQPEPPFIASIFHYYLSDNIDGYDEYDDLTLELAKNSPGYLGYESFKHDGRGSFISYWKDMDSVNTWAGNPIHKKAKERGKKSWYKYYHSEIATVNRFHSKS